jgi:uncharacterized membrane protein YbjE (DUF340 family)
MLCKLLCANQGSFEVELVAHVLELLSATFLRLIAQSSRQIIVLQQQRCVALQYSINRYTCTQYCAIVALYALL